MKIQKPADLARAVKTRRQAQGFTQQDIANAVGITRQSLARIERGHGGASFDTILRIFTELGLGLEATTDKQNGSATAAPPQNNDSPQQSATARNTKTSALTAAGDRNIDTSGSNPQASIPPLTFSSPASTPSKDQT